ncbi:HEAT repeat domain-containing protein [Catellatospora sp. TT07R-123]|uniref:HEAT repeat domain-containing protein n=1 Tax=Catellatospora sp. TT07R-123 TaxID=2733863 RepID=UPI001FD3BE88|nr:HEAT repeat domain-containing protein [Catellatospora sp. TT07R-123]
MDDSQTRVGFERAVSAWLADPTDGQALDEVLIPLARADPAGALELVRVRAGSPDADVRAVAAWLLFRVADVGDAQVRHRAAGLAAELYPGEDDPDVLVGLVRTFEFAGAGTRFGLSVLIALAAHPDSAVRFSVASALSSVIGAAPEMSEIVAAAAVPADSAAEPGPLSDRNPRSSADDRPSRSEDARPAQLLTVNVDLPAYPAANAELLTVNADLPAYPAANAELLIANADLEAGELRPGVAELIVLMGDVDQDVRDWATFGLGAQLDDDGPLIRRALWERTDDPYQDVREEAVRGLARRGDRRVLPLLARLLELETVGVAVFDAAAELADPSLVPLLREFSGAGSAIEACERGTAG